MTNSRRDFIKKATLLTGAAGLFSVLPESIQRALAIDAEKGSTYLDAEHVVFLMQENRSFDHCYGSLQGVRGFDDPRALHLPNKNKVWMQTNKAGETYVPFRLDIKNSKATWMQSLPHSWENQVDARNKGMMDNWLESKKSGNREYAKMPLTMGYYDRNDIPFYYALADAFTVCDQNFCSSLTGTSANRCYFWSGTIREEQNEDAMALVDNGEINYKDITWKTFPERLEKLGISWKVYQNELSIDVGFEGEEEDWLSNFTDNNLEFYKQYNVRLHKAHLNHLEKTAKRLESEIKTLSAQPGNSDQEKQLKEKSTQLENIKREQQVSNPERFNALSDFEKNIHLKAFTTNSNDPDYHTLESLIYEDGGVKREVKVPKGDVLHQFREDVNSGNLPTVSWLTAPANFSDHPGSPWYGAWYVSEAMDILTKNPEVWKKTIFILTYDENDGYFDHVAPFVPPHSAKPETGKCSSGLNTEVEHVTEEQEKKRGKNKEDQRASPIGLGFRVPMVVASPWSRGGWVNSQIFDHTSCLQFLETFLSKKTGKEVKETNISDWRRTVCGDLTSVFRPYHGEKIHYPLSLSRDKTVEGIHRAQFKQLPSNFEALSPEEIEKINKQPKRSDKFPKQEKGSRRSCALPYNLNTKSFLDKAKDQLTVSMKSATPTGAPFNVYASVLNKDQKEEVRCWDFAVKGNDEISYSWPLNQFKNGVYNLNLNGPNGFFRGFEGDKEDPQLLVEVSYHANGDMEFSIVNESDSNSYQLSIIDHSYQQQAIPLQVNQNQKVKQTIGLKASHGWYDLGILIEGHPKYVRRYAGRVETGKHGITDPLIGA